jgi:REP element-mobilizing transposase RayT
LSAAQGPIFGHHLALEEFRESRVPWQLAGIFGMRASRTDQLHVEEGFAHMFWRCHNKEFYLNSPLIKALYLACVKLGLQEKISGGNVLIYAFCVMSNHFHQVVHFKNSSAWFSNYMRYAHSLFGALYNKIHKRSGKVAEGRPQTPLIQDITHLMGVQFYVEANPIRAGLRKIENLRGYQFSSYRFYAFGIKDKHNAHLSTPDWYTELGETPGERQEKYRKLFREFVERDSQSPKYYFHKYIGTFQWKEARMEQMKALVRNKIALKSTTDPSDSS